VRIMNSGVDNIRVDDSSSYSIDGMLSSISGQKVDPGTLSGRVLLILQTDGSEIGAVVSRSGAFTFRDVPAGTYALKYESGSLKYAEGFALNGKMVFDKRLVVPPGPGNVLLTVFTHDSGSTLTGVLQAWNGHDVKGDVVARAESGQTYVSQTATDGSFRIVGLPPGGYELFGWAESNPIAYANPQELNKLGSFARQVSVEAGKEYSGITLQAIAPDL
jgi:hypothetical protein